MYNVQELSTAVQHGIHVLVVVFNNNSYGASEWHQTHDYKGRYIGTDLHNPDFVQLAESFGAVGMRTEPKGSTLPFRRRWSPTHPWFWRSCCPT